MCMKLGVALDVSISQYIVAVVGLERGFHLSTCIKEKKFISQVDRRRPCRNTAQCE